MSYRDHFRTRAEAARYDAQQYGAGSYSQFLWTIEADQLLDILNDRGGGAQLDYLDFACGTGRVLGHLGSRVSTSRGIEISSAMAERARLKTPGAVIDCRDITADDAAVEGRYDLITAFRFILNAEPALREKAMLALAARLRNERSILVYNNHGNMMSHKLITLPLHWVRQRSGSSPTGNLLSHSEVVRLARRAGLETHRVAGCGLFGGRLARRLPDAVVERLERRFARSRAAGFGSNQIYVARLQGVSSDAKGVA